MVRMEIRDFGQEEWNDIVSSIDMPSLMQTWEFGEAKAETGLWKVSRAVFQKGDETVGAAQAMIRTVPFLNRGLVWINRAPLLKNCDTAQSDVYIDMLRELKKYWVDEKKMYLRIAPPLMASDENYEIFEKAGYLRATKTDGSASEIVDLSCSIEELRRRLQRNWKRNLKKAENTGVKCVHGATPKLLAEVCSDYDNLLKKKKVKSSVSVQLIKSIYELSSKNSRLVVFAGRVNGHNVGSIVFACYGQTFMSLAEGISEDGKRSNVNHYLIWNAICSMKKLAYKCFDVGGAHPDKTLPGILYFKRGLRGKPYQLMGEVEAYRDGFLNRMIRKRIESRI